MPSATWAECRGRTGGWRRVRRRPPSPPLSASPPASQHPELSVGRHYRLLSNCVFNNNEMQKNDTSKLCEQKLQIRKKRILYL